MNGYTIIVKSARAVLVVAVCLCVAGCAGDVWMTVYRLKGGYGRQDTEMRRRGDAEVWRNHQQGRGTE